MLIFQPQRAMYEPIASDLADFPDEGIGGTRPRRQRSAAYYINLSEAEAVELPVVELEAATAALTLDEAPLSTEGEQLPVEQLSDSDSAYTDDSQLHWGGKHYYECDERCTGKSVSQMSRDMIAFDTKLSIEMPDVLEHLNKHHLLDTKPIRPVPSEYDVIPQVSPNMMVHLNGLFFKPTRAMVSRMLPDGTCAYYDAEIIEQGQNWGTDYLLPQSISVMIPDNFAEAPRAQMDFNKMDIEHLLLLRKSVHAGVIGNTDVLKDLQDRYHELRKRVLKDLLDTDGQSLGEGACEVIDYTTNYKINGAWENHERKY